MDLYLLILEFCLFLIVNAFVVPSHSTFAVTATKRTCTYIIYFNGIIFTHFIYIFTLYIYRYIYIYIYIYLHTLYIYTLYIHLIVIIIHE